MYRSLVLLISILITICILSINFEVENIEDNKEIYIEVHFENQESKIVSLPLGSRISDLLKIIDVEDEYDLSIYSLNETLYNNQILVFNLKNDKQLISINSAPIEVLITLPGIGESIAHKIIDYRETYGSFNSLEELKNVNGIGTKKYEKLKEYISL